MFSKHKYFYIVCIVILLITLSIGTLFIKEGYDDYLNKLLADRGYQLPAPRLPGSSGYRLETQYICADGTNRLDHIDSDCSKPLRTTTVNQASAAESCTITTSGGETVDSCKTISNSLFCDTNNICNTVNTKELAAGQTCKYNNDCLSRSCINNICQAEVLPSRIDSPFAFQTLGTNIGSGSGASVSNLDDFFRLLNTNENIYRPTTTPVTTIPIDEQARFQENLNKLREIMARNQTVQPTTSTTRNLTSQKTETIMPSKNTTQMSVGTRGQDFYNKVKNMMAEDIDSILSRAKSDSMKNNQNACLDSCC
jgi:hypothetical protein